jgi:antitoxin (DNA-binding transcriptional repressor) of toxin-antitoxin stability system
MARVNLHDARTQLSRLVPLAARTAPRRPGTLAGQVRVAPGFGAPLPPDLAEALGAASRRGCCSTRTR